MIKNPWLIKIQSFISIKFKYYHWLTDWLTDWFSSEKMQLSCLSKGKGIWPYGTDLPVSGFENNVITHLAWCYYYYDYDGLFSCVILYYTMYEFGWSVSIAGIAMAMAMTC